MMGRHRDTGGYLPPQGRWIAIDGSLMRRDSQLLRDEYGLPEKTVQPGQSWEDGDE